MADLEAEIGELPLESVGEKLRLAREAAGLSHADVAATTKIPLRHLISLDQNDYSEMPGRTYILGFARTYAKAVGLDADSIAHHVKAELDSSTLEASSRAQSGFEPGDPARVPSRRLAWLAALGAVVAALLVFLFWRSFLAPADQLPPAAKPSAAATVSAQNPAFPLAGASAGATAPAGLGPITMASGAATGTAGIAGTVPGHQPVAHSQPAYQPHHNTPPHPVAHPIAPAPTISAAPPSAAIAIPPTSQAPSAAVPVAKPSAAKPSTVTP